MQQSTIIASRSPDQQPGAQADSRIRRYVSAFFTVPAKKHKNHNYNKQNQQVNILAPYLLCSAAPQNLAKM